MRYGGGGVCVDGEAGGRSAVAVAVDLESVPIVLHRGDECGAGGAGVSVLEGGGNSAVEVDSEEDRDFAKVAEEARIGFEKAG